MTKPHDDPWRLDHPERPAARFRLALFDVDTREPAADGERLVFRPRVEAIRENLQRLLALQQDARRLTVVTSCLNARPVRPLLPDTARYVEMEEGEIDWRGELAVRREFFLEKRTLGSPEKNVCHCAFDVFRWNPHTAGLVQAAEVDRWCVFGVSLECCVHATVGGLLSLDQTVTVIEDAVLARTEESHAGVLEELHARGAAVISTAEFLRTHA